LEGTDVGVINFSAEDDFWWSHGIIIREEKFSIEGTAFIASAVGA
jgi:hypothetical protein